MKKSLTFQYTFHQMTYWATAAGIVSFATAFLLQKGFAASVVGTLLASGNLFLTAEMLARLALVCCGSHPGFIDDRCLKLMRTPTTDWPQQDVRMRHGMGLLSLDDRQVLDRPLWGHQGFAYGAVNGVFFDENGNGFAALNSGAGEKRYGHLAAVNRSLITALLTCAVLALLLLYGFTGRRGLLRTGRIVLSIAVAVSLCPLLLGVTFFSAVGAGITVLLAAELLVLCIAPPK